MIKSRAALMRNYHEPLVIETVDVRSPGPNEVLVEFKATGICHTDLSLIDKHIPTELPAVLGHEGAGIVVEAGPNVTYVKPGDHVIGHPMPHCGWCPACVSDKANFCDDYLQGNVFSRTGFSLRGQRVTSFVGLGTFSNFAVVHENQLAKIHPDAPLDKVCTIGCGVATGIGSALLCAQVKRGSSVIVIGLGGVGLAVIQGCRIAGARTIIGVDTRSDKEAVARTVGATDFINPGQLDVDIVRHLLDFTKGGADYTFECVGNPKLMEQALAVTAMAGTCSLVGWAPDFATMQVSPGFLMQGRRLMSNIHGNTRVRRDFPQFVDWYMEGRINLDAIVSHVLPFERINEAIDLMRTGKTIRPVITY